MEDDEIEIYNKSKESLLRILDLNMTSDQYLNMCHQDNQLVWKVLILDEYSSLVLAPLIHVTDLRLHNVPQFLSLSSRREPLRSMTIIYLIEPILKNIQTIIQDCKTQLYDHFQINFIYPPSETILRTLATGLVEEKSVIKLNKIFQQYFRYIVLEPSLFTLAGPSFQELNQPGVSDEEIEFKLDQIALSLFCLIKNCKFWPIIKSGRGMSEVVARKLTELCWENNDEVCGMNRPLLLIVDRSIDISIMLHHPWSYQSLLLDVFNNSMNKVAVPSNPPQISELDKQKDQFWKEEAYLDFDVVLQHIDKQFNEWKLKYDKIGENILEAFENVTDLTDKKAQLDLHMILATEMVKIVKTRHLDHFNQTEETLMKGKSIDIEDLLNLDSADENIEKDQLRLMIINFLSNNKEFEKYQQLFSYLRNYKVTNTNEGTMKYLVGIAGKMKDKFMGYEKMLPITKLLHSAMENKEKDLDYFDTRYKNGQKYKREFTEAVVFVVGGGSYTEYQNLMQYKESSGKNIIYGSTSIISPNDFLFQLKALSEY
jgi:sec1 family domain-containing protein 1